MHLRNIWQWKIFRSRRMTIQEATAMFSHAQLSSDPQLWLDLGCGAGKFTQALAALLPPGSTVIGVDADYQNLPNPMGAEVIIKFQQGNMLDTQQLPQAVDGILMANSIHYIKDKLTFLQDLELCFKDRAHFLLVEYDTKTSNRWVPHPLPFDELEALFAELNYNYRKKLSERPSLYRSSNLYAAQILR